MFSEIKKPIQKEFNSFQEVYLDAFKQKSNNPLLSQVFAHILSKKGKQLRPIVTLLSGKLCGNVTTDTYNCATALELLHTASLLHDDVVDNTLQRRGQKSINSLFNNRISILVGDLLLSTSMEYITKPNKVKLMRCFSELGATLTIGELQQMDYSYKIPTEEQYFEIIKNKTAILFAICSQIGAISAGASEKEELALRAFGYSLGICFQIKDDIFDYTIDANVGKPTVNDIKEGKLTIPIIQALKLATAEEKATINRIINSHSISKEEEIEVVELVNRYGGISYAEMLMKHYQTEAIKHLNIFEDCEEKQGLLDTLQYAIERKL